VIDAMHKVMYMLEAVADCCADSQLADLLAERAPYRWFLDGGREYLGRNSPVRWDQLRAEVSNSWEWVIERVAGYFDWLGEPGKLANTGPAEFGSVPADRPWESYQEDNPVVRAQAAKGRGDRFFETTMPVSQISGGARWGTTRTQTETGDYYKQPDALGAIESVGWKLEHVGYVFLETGTISTRRVLLTGEKTATTGVLTGIYLFRNSG